MLNSFNRRYFILLGLLFAVVGFCHASTHPKLLVLGDSMSAEYGLPRGTGWVSLMAERLKKEKPTATVINASISGDTSFGGRSRLPALLAQHQPSIVLIELGGNDALRGLALQTTRENLEFMVKASQLAGAKVVLIGMQVPPNYGPDYANQFAGLFRSVAKERKTSLVPFLLKNVADRPDPTQLFQADRIHPNEQAQPLMLENVWSVLRKLL